MTVPTRSVRADKQFIADVRGAGSVQRLFCGDVHGRCARPTVGFSVYLIGSQRSMFLTSYAYRQRTYVFINYFNGIVEGEGLEVGNDPVAPCGAPRAQCTDEWRLRRLLSHVVAV